MMWLRLARSTSMAVLAIAAAMAWHGASAGPAAAQTGVAGPPEVTVDLSVLNTLEGGQPHRRHVDLRRPHERDQAEREAHKPGNRAARKTEPHVKKAAARTPSPAKRAEKRKPAHAAHRNTSDADAQRATRDEAAREAERKHDEAQHKRSEAERIKREEAKRIAEAKAEIAAAARQTPPKEPVKESTGGIANPGPGPATPAPPQTIAQPEEAPAKSSQVAAVAPPPASPPQHTAEPPAQHAHEPSPAAPAKPAMAAKPAAVERTSVANPHIDFAAGDADLTPSARAELDAIAKTLAADDSKRVQLVAYATGSNDEANQARRLSLSRALNVRAYLIDHGVRNTRMDVRALGNRPDGSKPVDRVDILFLDNK